MRACSRAAEIGIKVLNTATARIAFSCSTARRLQRRRTVLDGMEAEARQADRVQPAAARRRRYSYTVQLGDLSVLPSVKFVITLDGDTQLPLEAGPAMVGTLAHPLNRPRFDRRSRVTAGYVFCSRASRSPGQRQSLVVLADLLGHVGIDPYTTAASDVYQDLFRGQLRRQGIYDVDAFERSLAGRVPDNRSQPRFVRGLLRPRRAVQRHRPHRQLPGAVRPPPASRWVRGDWQICPGSALVRDADGERRGQPAAAIARWKFLDNLRRSLMPPALVVADCGWSSFPGAGAVDDAGTARAPFPRSAPVILHLLSGWPGWPCAIRPRRAGERPGGLAAGGVVARHSAASSALMLDAIVRDAFPPLVSRRQLLEWETAAARSAGRWWAGSSSACGVAPIIAVAGRSCYFPARRRAGCCRRSPS